MTAKQRKLQLSYDPHIIDHLGIKMYATLPNVLAELIANAYVNFQRFSTPYPEVA